MRNQKLSISSELGNYELELYPIKRNDKVKKLPNVDDEGNRIKKVREQESVYKWVYESGDKVPETKLQYGKKAFKLLENGEVGEPKGYTKRTKEVECEVIDLPSAYDLATETQYFSLNKELAEKLNEQDKALKFFYSNGRGYKVYLAMLYPFRDGLVMSCGHGKLSNKIKKLVEQLNSSKKLKNKLVETGDKKKASVNEMADMLLDEEEKEEKKKVKVEA